MPTQNIAIAIVKKLKKKGHTAYFAGGWVRDFLLKHPSDDIDIATTAAVAEIQALFPKTIPVGIAFGIVIVVEEGRQFEVATFRKERGYIDGRRPTKVERATPKEDALRRDFTINGLFYDPTTEELFDYVSGRADIKEGIIRAIGNPSERFLEDRLRMMRAVRYSTRFGFPIHKETEEAIRLHAHSLLPAVAMERVWQEFTKMSHFAHFDAGLVKLHQLGLLQTIFPDLQHLPSEEIVQLTAPIERFPKGAPTIAELMELFPNYTLAELLDVCDYLKLSNEDKAFVRFHHHSHSLFAMPHNWQERLEPHEWAAFYAHPHAPLSLEIIAARFENKGVFLNEHAERQKELAPFITRIREKRPVVRAEHLIAEGISPSEQMGLLLKEAERISVNKNLENTDQVLALLKQTALWKNSAI